MQQCLRSLLKIGNGTNQNLRESMCCRLLHSQLGKLTTYYSILTFVTHGNVLLLLNEYSALQASLTSGCFVRGSALPIKLGMFSFRD